MNKLTFHLGYLLISALLVAILSILLSYYIINDWYEDGFDRLEISFMSLLPSLIFFVIILLSNIFLEVRYLKECQAENIIPIKMFFQIIYASFYVVLAALIFDSLYYYFIDSTIAKEFADGLKNMMEVDGKAIKSQDIEDFREMPFLLQNFFALSFFCILSNAIALPLGRVAFSVIYKE